MKKNVKISIIGSCVSRDAFEIPKGMKEYGKNETNYTVERYIQSINPLSAVTPPIEDVIADALIAEMEKSTAPNMYKRCFRLDAKSAWEDYLSEVKSDWLIIDMSTVRLACHRIGSGYMTFEDLGRKVVSNVVEGSNCLTFKRLEEGDALSIADLEKKKQKAVYKEYFRRLCKLYPQKRIIVIDAKQATASIDSERFIVASMLATEESRYRKDNIQIDLAYRYAKEMMPNAYFIDSLPILVADVRHKWGRLGLHYVGETYMYLYRAMDYIIREKPSKRRVRSYFHDLRDEYTRKVFERYSSAVARSTQAKRNLLEYSKGMWQGIYRQNGLELVIDEEFGYTLRGVAEKDTAFYLYHGQKNPCGAWQPVSDETPAGIYLFSTGMKNEETHVAVQMVLSNVGGEQKWIPADLPFGTKLEKTYSHKLIRLIVASGTDVQINGKLCLERID